MAAAYQLTADPHVVLRTADNASIPDDPNNRDWQDYQAWLAAGNTPDPYVAPVPPPKTTVTVYQWEQALDANGLLNDWEAWVATLNPNKQRQANDANGLDRHGLLDSSKHALGGGLSPAQMDALFAQAVAVPLTA